VRAHDGRVIASASNQRWSSHALEINCWNGEVVRVAFAIDTHDREVIAWVASTGGITGQMVRDLMQACVEERFGGVRVPHLVQWLAGNGSAYTAAETLAFAAALGLLPCFTCGKGLSTPANRRQRLPAQSFPGSAQTPRRAICACSRTCCESFENCAAPCAHYWRQGSSATHFFSTPLALLLANLSRLSALNGITRARQT
jgi:transposase InsO family protein